MTNQTIAAPLEEAFKTFERTQLGWAAAGFAAERYAEDPAALAEFQTLPLAVALDLTVKGPIVCTSENWLLDAGDVKAHALMASSDVIIPGSLEARHGVTGLNNWNQSFWVRGALNTPVFATQDYATECGAVNVEAVELSDARAHEPLAPGLASELRGWQDDWGAAGRLLERVEQQKPMFREQSWLELERRR